MLSERRVLDVLLVAYPFAPVEPDAVGGAEQIVAALDAALVASGHRSTVLAAQGSRVAGRLVPVDVGSGELSQERILRVRQQYSQTLQRLLAEQAFDLVHFHGCDCAAYLTGVLPSRALPKLVTLHVPGDWYEPGLFRPELGLSFVCVSSWQREQVCRQMAVRETIENGVDLARWQPSAEAPRDYVLCLGRVSPEKGFDRALRAAHLADVPLLLAGHVYPYPEHQRHFAQQIEPFLDERRRFVGPVAGLVKRRLLAQARCLAVTSRVSETSSLVAMEALACGTPVVVASPGAPATLIEPGATGLVAGDESELAQAFAQVVELDRSACRLSAERRFDVRRMSSRYLDLYRELVNERFRQAALPAAPELSP
jgi:glycosyltransferase involved in cell wall biosynthesis